MRFLRISRSHRISRWRRADVSRVALALVLVASMAGCSPGTDSATSSSTDSSADVARAKAHWKLQVETDGSKNDIVLDGMDIFLVDDEEQWPEIYEITGPDVTLVGAFPMDLHVGYGAEFEKLIGKSVRIEPHGGDPRDPKNSTVRLAGTQVPILGGSLHFEKVTGKWDGEQGDKTLWGQIQLRVPGASGDRTVRGSFAVHAVTWG